MFRKLYRSFCSAVNSIVVAVKPKLATMIGSASALVVSQLLYLYQARSVDGWATIPVTELSAQLGVTESAIRTARNKLKRLGILEERKDGTFLSICFNDRKFNLVEYTLQYFSGVKNGNQRIKTIVRTKAFPGSYTAEQIEAELSPKVVKFRSLGLFTLHELLDIKKDDETENAQVPPEKEDLSPIVPEKISLPHPTAISDTIQNNYAKAIEVYNEGIKENNLPWARQTPSRQLFRAFSDYCSACIAGNFDPIDTLRQALKNIKSNDFWATKTDCNLITVLDKDRVFAWANMVESPAKKYAQEWDSILESMRRGTMALLPQEIKLALAQMGGTTAISAASNFQLAECKRQYLEIRKLPPTDRPRFVLPDPPPVALPPEQKKRTVSGLMTTIHTYFKLGKPDLALRKASEYPQFFGIEDGTVIPLVPLDTSIDG